MDDDTPLSPDETRSLRFLKGLVTVLTATMILGVLAIIVLLVIRLQTPPAPAFPSSILLPEGAEATAFTRGDGWLAVVTRDGRILIYGEEGGAVVQEIEVDLP
jgi:hypothetical protein